MKVPQTRNELLEQFQENLNWLRNSMAAFDAGDLSQAKLMAGHVRTLLHDGGARSQSRSLVTQLGFGPNMVMISTARKHDKRNILGNEARLCTLTIRDGIGSWQAVGQYPDGDRKKQLFFPDWWKEIVIDAPGVSMSRRQVVTLLAEKLGGLHSDPTIDSDHAHLLRNNPISVLVDVNGQGPMRVQKVELHSMRQIALEVVISIERKLAKG